jgi:hypothetical protein
MASSAAHVACVIITSTVSSRDSRRQLGLKMGYASSRVHNNKTSRSGLGYDHKFKLKHGLKCCACRSCFHNSNGVLKTLAQGVRIDGVLCEFARAQQREPLGLRVGHASSRAHNNNTNTNTNTNYVRARTTTTTPTLRPSQMLCLSFVLS